jgi:hypothetical protein
LLINLYIPPDQQAAEYPRKSPVCTAPLKIPAEFKKADIPQNIQILAPLFRSKLLSSFSICEKREKPNSTKDSPQRHGRQGDKCKERKYPLPQRHREHREYQNQKGVFKNTNSFSSL